MKDHFESYDDNTLWFNQPIQMDQSATTHLKKLATKINQK